MGGWQDPATQVTLLARLRNDPADQSAWREFVSLYGGRISGWCRRWGLQEADVEDVAQTVLLKLAAKMREFQYDPHRSFRAFLKTLTRHALSDFLDRRGRLAPGFAGGDSRLGEILQAVEARDDLARQLERAFDHEVLAAAMSRVRARVAPQTWEAFRLTAIEGLAGAEAAARIPMRVAQVFVAKRRIQQMIRDEVRASEERCPPAIRPATPSTRRPGGECPSAGPGESVVAPLSMEGP
jgi:RNA polymerase sigma factor (sigma-70 family)